jgi:hypothetical protein
MKSHFIPTPTWRRHEWKGYAGQSQYCDSLHTVVGTFTVRPLNEESFELEYPDDTGYADYPTWEEAKTAAEEEYERQFYFPDSLFGKKMGDLLNEGFEVCGVLLRKPGHCMTLSVEGKAVVHDPFTTIGAS